MTTTEDQTQTLAARIAPTVAHLAHLLEQRADVDARIERAKADLRAAVPGPDTYGGADGGLALVITPNRRLDVDAAAAAVIATGVAPDAVRKVAWDPAKLRRHLTPDQAETFMVDQGDTKVTLR